VKAALPLAEKAARLVPNSADYRNTLGVAYYRAGRFREAVETLRPNLDSQEDWTLAIDLFFLAMSHHHLGGISHARDYYELGIRWSNTHRELSAKQWEELKLFRDEAEELLGIDRMRNKKD
jgi:tetratricopeptide (TPR) repeat protein